MRRFLLASFLVLASSVTANAQNPDVIVGDLQEVASWGRVGDIVAYSIGTTSCNIGNEELLWIAGTNEHPVIGQELYRHKDGVMEQVGFGWLKHGFCALSQNLCDPCNPTPCETLGIGCSDPYTAGRNGTQGTLGPRSQVDAWTGYYPYPFTAPPADPVIGRRVQVNVDDVDPTMNAGATYWVSGHYVTPDDAVGFNHENNVSYRQVAIEDDPTEYTMSLIPGETTVQMSAPIYQWPILNPNVELQEIRVPGEGLLVLAHSATQNPGGDWHYEYALYNMNSDISAGAFSVEVATGATITNADHFQVPYHSGEPYSTADWTINTTSSEISFETTPFSVDENANALRWSRMFNFRFDSDAAPVAVTAEVGLFKTPGSIAVTVQGPGTPPIPQPENLVCLPTPTGADLTWTNPIPYAQIELFRNGISVGVLDGSTTSYFDDQAQQQNSYTYALTAYDGPDAADPVGCLVDIPFFPDYTRGDVNNDGTFDVSDAVFHLAALFIIGSPQPGCADAADSNDDGVADISDPVFTLFALFLPGSPPPPEPASCSWDPTPDSLGCETYTACP